MASVTVESFILSYLFLNGFKKGLNRFYTRLDTDNSDAEDLGAQQRLVRQ